MSPLTARLTAAALALVAAQPVLAQTEPEPQADSDILVTTGRKAQQEAISDLARAVSGRLPFGKPIVRYHRPLCLAISGVSTKFVDAFAARIINNAKDAGVPIASGNCQANALVIFASDSRKELEQARKNNRWIFGDLPRDAIKRLVESRDPAFAWRASEILGTNGLPIFNDPRELPVNRTTEMAGRLQQPYKLDVAGAVVMIDRDAAKSLTPQQLADYATLRLLTPTEEVREIVPGAPETIMTMFLDPENAPAGLTDFDTAYLRGVYSIRDNVPATAVYGEVLTRLVRGDKASGGTAAADQPL